MKVCREGKIASPILQMMAEYIGVLFDRSAAAIRFLISTGAENGSLQAGDVLLRGGPPGRLNLDEHLWRP
jgi:hypothetical protein